MPMTASAAMAAKAHIDWRIRELLEERKCIFIVKLLRLIGRKSEANCEKLVSDTDKDCIVCDDGRGIAC